MLTRQQVWDQVAGGKRGLNKPDWDILFNFLFVVVAENNTDWI